MVTKTFLELLTITLSIFRLKDAQANKIRTIKHIFYILRKFNNIIPLIILFSSTSNIKHLNYLFKIFDLINLFPVAYENFLITPVVSLS